MTEPRGSTRALRQERQRAIVDIINGEQVANQDELVRLLADRGFRATQATVSRDIAEIGVVKAIRGGRYTYTIQGRVAERPPRDDLLRRLIADLPLEIRRSGLTLLLKASPGAANAIAEAIDRSSLDEQEGTLAGDDTLLVLFADERRLLAWLRRLEALGGPGITPPRPI
jgi:transcriptional regulator of arginine metabolism